MHFKHRAKFFRTCRVEAILPARHSDGANFDRRKLVRTGVGELEVTRDREFFAAGFRT